MTAQRAALRRVKAFLATFTAKDDGQRFCATAIDSTFTKPRLVKFTVADLRAVLALAERAMEAERPGFVTIHMARADALALGLLVCECGHPPNNHFEHVSRPCAQCSCGNYVERARRGALLAPPRAGKRAKR